MGAIVIDGKKIAQDIKSEIATKVVEFKKETSKVPFLSVVMVGEDVGSKIYVRNKIKACQETGINYKLYTLSKNIDQSELLSLIDCLNADELVHGILVQLPLPHHINKFKVFDAVATSKDVDCFHPINTGYLIQDRPKFKPCTPQAIVKILEEYDISTVGRRVCVINRSLIVGQPLANMLIQDNQFANATVTVCHDQTSPSILKETTQTSDIVITAVGKRPLFSLGPDHFNENSVIIDAAINRDEFGKIIGDVDFDLVKNKVKAITIVPGSVGPVTVAFLLKNVVKAAKFSCGLL